MKKIHPKLRKAIKAEYNMVRREFNEAATMKFALMLDNYGPFVKHKSYEITQEGFDWFKLKNHGKTYFVASSLVHANPFDFLIEEGEDEEELELDENFIFQY